MKSRHFWMITGLFVSSPAFASSEFVSWTTIGLHAFNLAVLIALIVKFGGKPIQRALNEKADAVAREVDEAAKLNALAAERFAQAEQQLAEVAERAKALLDEQRREAAAEREALLMEAQLEAARIQREAVLAAKQEVERARTRLSAMVVEEAMAAAEQLIRENVTAADHTRLTAEYLGRLEDVASTSTRRPS